MKELLFVYGSMKRSFINHSRLEKEKFIGEAITKDKYNMYPSFTYRFPYAIEDEKKWQLKGELYKITTNDMINIIDVFEGVPVHYYRKVINVFCNEKEYKCYIYFRSEENPYSFDFDLPMSEWIEEFEVASLIQNDFLDALGIAIEKVKELENE